jgi:MFS family permease
MTIVMAACAIAPAFVPDVRVAEGRVGDRLRGIARDFVQMIHAPIALLVICLVASPIGAGGAGNVWSAVAKDWRASADLVAAVTGFLWGIVSVVGCVLGGALADRIGRWRTFFGAGAYMALVAAVVSLVPRTPASYGVGVVAYAFSVGLAYAAYSALVLLAVGRGAASTKYAILGSVGNIPVVYMTALAGWAHETYGPAGMLQVEAVVSVAAIAVGVLAVLLMGAGQEIVADARPASVDDSGA